MPMLWTRAAAPRAPARDGRGENSCPSVTPCSDVQPIAYRGRVVAACTGECFLLAADLAYRPPGDPELVFVVTMCAYAMPVLSPSAEGLAPNGSTSSPSDAPRSSAFATATPPSGGCPRPSAPARPPFASATRRCWPRTAACATRSPNSRHNSRSPTGNGEPRTDKPAADPCPRGCPPARTEPESGGSAAPSAEAVAPGRARSRAWRPSCGMESAS
jgi:hypothetical protein